MNGANEFANMFATGQHGRLYLVSSSHARGNTFRIFVLPANTVAIPNCGNAPLNEDAVEVYGITGGQPGWTEKYGWLHEGKWQQDFAQLVETRKNEIELARVQRQRQAEEQGKAAAVRVSELLADY